MLPGRQDLDGDTDHGAASPAIPAQGSEVPEHSTASASLAIPGQVPEETEPTELQREGVEEREPENGRVAAPSLEDQSKDPLHNRWREEYLASLQALPTLSRQPTFEGTESWRVWKTARERHVQQFGRSPSDLRAGGWCRDLIRSAITLPQKTPHLRCDNLILIGRFLGSEAADSSRALRRGESEANNTKRAESLLRAKRWFTKWIQDHT
eukprot:gnl/TRDRNA2_/TRDRNA2_155915_c0_seq2.p1 gnl/TRDRNA2_/TRDRNA2_155915_c0~~gnl/TRDRNA2_/TRDRNA2_155915_c0_seq2.p1  ORF type:complete len:220 (+),score=21.72 gnl/TRDRNA2_/TRDRNA2_155915_c0_seq2:31-660(+)